MATPRHTLIRPLLGLAAALAAALAPLLLAPTAPARDCTIDNNCADISVSGHAEPQPIRRGERTTLKITPKNNGPRRTFGVKVAVTVPKGLQVKRKSVSGDGNDHGCSDNGYGYVECFPGDLEPEELAVVKIRVKAKKKGTWISRVNVYSEGTNDPNGGNNQVGITVGVGSRR